MGGMLFNGPREFLKVLWALLRKPWCLKSFSTSQKFSEHLRKSLLFIKVAQKAYRVLFANFCWFLKKLGTFWKVLIYFRNFFFASVNLVIFEKPSCLWNIFCTFPKVLDEFQKVLVHFMKSWCLYHILNVFQKIFMHVKKSQLILNNLDAMQKFSINFTYISESQGIFQKIWLIFENSGFLFRFLLP